MKHYQIICSPHIYFSSLCQNLIECSTKKSYNNWIYHISSNDREAVLYQNKEFTICRDIPKKDETHTNKMLVVFHDTSLRTIRDLRQRHIPMLLNAYSEGIKLIDSDTRQEWSIYFNYFPSNYQLHAHISPRTSHMHLRSHNILRVVRNLDSHDAYYKDALLFTRLSRNNAVYAAYEYHFTDVSFKMNRILGNMNKRQDTGATRDSNSMLTA